MDLTRTCLAALATLAMATPALAGEATPALNALISQHARANGVPEALVHRVIVRESRYNPSAMHAGNYGLMQIRHGTARGLGYKGSAHGLLDPNTNLTYAVAYLANAYKVADGNHNRAVSLYAGGYYYAAKRKGMLARITGPAARTVEVASAGEPEASAMMVKAAPEVGSIPLSAFQTAAR